MPDSSAGAIYLRIGPEFISRLREVVEEAKGGDPLGRVTFITPSYYSSFYLRRSLSAGGLFNVDFVRIEDIAEALALKHLTSRGTKSLTRLRAGELVYAAGQEASLEGPLKGVAGLPSFHSALHRTLNDLEAEQITAPSGRRTRITRAAFAGLGRVESDLGEIWDAYDRKKTAKGFHDRTEVAHAASNAVIEGALSAPHARLAYGSLFALLMAMPSPQYRELWRTLARAPGVRVVAGVTGDRKSDEAVCNAAGIQPPPEDIGGPEAPPARLVSAPDARSEVTAAVREIFAAAERGTPFNRMAVLYGNRSYAARIEDALVLACVPVSGPDSATLAASPVGRFITGVLDIASSEFSREKVGHWLTAAPVKDGESGRQVPGSTWDGISRAAGITRGEAQWKQRLERFTSRQSRHAQSVEDNSDGDGDAALRAEGLKKQAEDARSLGRFIEGLASCLARPEQGSWRQHRDWLRTLTDSYLYAPPGSGTAETLEKINSVLDGIAELDSLESGTPSFSRFEQVVRDELSCTHGGRRTLGRGVFVGPLSAAAGCHFDLVHIVGMADGAFPSPDRPDPLLPDSTRELLNAQYKTELPVAAGRLAARRREFHVALRSGDQAALYWPRSSGAGARETGPAQWMVDEAQRWQGNEAVQAGDFLSRPQTIHGLTIAAPAAGGPLADEHEYDLLDVQSWAGGSVGSQAKHFLEQDPVTGIAAALELEKGRYGGAWGHWAGDLSFERPTAGGLSRGTTSASRIQTYASCPLNYFFGYVLSIPPTEKPEDDIYLPSDRSGTFVHKVLQTYLRLRMKRGLPSSEAVLDEAFDIEKKEWEQTEPTGNAVVWEIEAADLRRRLRRWVAAERELGEAGFSPDEAEKAFGRGEALPAVVPLSEGSTMSFSGVIDRIDLDRGSTVYVFDYKTGSSSSYKSLKKDPVDAGRRLQLAVYAEAVRNIYPDAVDVRAAYWFVLDSDSEMLPEPEQFDLAALTDRLREVAQVVNDSIASGYFPPNPGKTSTGRKSGNCTYCDFNRVCPSGIRRQRMLEKHKAEPRLRPYFNLSDGEGGDEG